MAKIANKRKTKHRATKPNEGNPKWVKGGKSPNPSGRPKVNEAFRAICRKTVDEHVIAAWIDEVVMRGKEWVRCSELLAAYGYGKPTQPVTVDPAKMADDELRAAAIEIVEAWKQEGMLQ